MRGTPIALVTGLVLGACFSDSEPAAADCPDGSEGCPCLELQCEAGLMCQDAVCVNPDGPTSGPSTSGPTTGPNPGTDPTSAGPGDDTGTPTTTGSTSDADSTGTPTVCGDGVLDSDEACDGTPGCSPECTFTEAAWQCNPLNNYPCPDGFKCSVIEPKTGPESTCLPVPTDPLVDQTKMPPPGQVHESNCYYKNGLPHDEWCDVGLACASSSFVDACESNCCVEFCDLTAGFTCTGRGDTCQVFFAPGVPAGLAHLGWCITP